MNIKTNADFKTHKLKKPCQNCPFMKKAKGYDPVRLNKARAESIAKSVFVVGENFGCHKTTTHDDMEYQYTNSESQCAGAAIMQINNDMLSTWMQIAMRMGWSKEMGIDDLDLSASVFETPQDFINFHDKYGI